MTETGLSRSDKATYRHLTAGFFNLDQGLPRYPSDMVLKYDAQFIGPSQAGFKEGMIVTSFRRISLSALTLAVALATANASFAQTGSGPMDMTGQGGHADMNGQSKQAGMMGQGNHSDMNSAERPKGMMGTDMPQMMSMMRTMMDMMSVSSGMMSSDAAGRIAALKVDLKITDAQAPLWNRFADALRGTAMCTNDLYQQMMQPDLAASLPTRLDRQEALLSAHLAAVKSLEAALTPLYNSFSAEQKKRADELLIGPMGMM